MSNKHYKIEDFITGAGGGKSGSARAPVEAPNTLQSRATIRVQEVLSEGEIKGIVGGLKGIFLDQTVIQNADGTYNFPALAYDFRSGTETQTYMPGFPGAESALVVNAELNPSLTRTVSDATVDAVRVTVRLPNGLFSIDTENGDSNGYRVGIAIDVRPTGMGTWTTALSKTITGKTTTPYEESFRVEKPSGISTTWDVRVRRTTAKADKQSIADRVDWFVMTEIQDVKISYPNAAVVGLAIDSESTGGAVPTRSYLVDGIMIQVPTNYTPTVYNSDGTVASYASYSGTWDGTFKTAWCDDPAWVLYDLLTNERYGLGQHIDTSTIDIYSFYEASKYNCELIDDGTGTDTLEPRFRFNTALQAREDAYKVLQTIAASFRCVIFSAPGLIRLIQDRPTPVSFAVNNANVIDGAFAYTGTELGSRVTAVDVSFNDINQNYTPRTISEEASAADMARYGFVKLEITPIGVINEGQARRLAKWIIDGSLNPSDTVQFSVSWQNAFMELGDVITVSDNWYANEAFSGVIVAIEGGTANQIKFDRDVTVSSGTVVKYLTFDGIEVTRTIATGGTGDTFTLNALAGAPNPNDYPNAAFSILENVEPRQFKVNGVRESSVGVYEITAVQHDPTKYARIEEGVYVKPPVFTNIGGWSIGTPQNVTVTPETYTNRQGAIRYRLRFNWDDVTDTLLKGYRIRYRRNNGQYAWINDILQSEYTLEDALPGIYDYTVYAYNLRGVQSPGADGYYNLNVNGAGTSPLGAPTGLALDIGGTAFTSTKFAFHWTAPAASTNATLKDYVIQFLDSSDNVVHTIYQIDTSLTVTRQDIINWYGSAIRSIKVGVRARDTLERLTVAASTVFTNAAPTVPAGISLTAFFNYYQVSHGALAADAEGVLIYHSNTSGFTPSKTNLVKDDVGTDHLIEANSNTTYYVKLAAYDEWGTDELNYSSQYSVTTLSTDIGVTPEAPTGLAVTSTLVTSDTGSQSAQITISWNKAANATSYDLEIIEGTSAAYYPMVSQPDTGTVVQYQLSGKVSTLYKVKVRGRAANHVSVWSAQVSHTTTGDTTAPTTPTGLTATSGYQAVSLKWTNPTDADFSHTEVWRAKTNAPTEPLSLLTKVSAPSSFYFDGNLTAGDSYSYRIKAVDTSGNVSASSANVIVTVSGLPFDSVGTDQILDDAITNLKLAQDAVDAANIITGAITPVHFSTGIEPVGIVTGTLPTVKSTEVITFNGKLYRWNGSAYVASLSATDITGTLTNAQIAAIAASKITGQLTSAQIASLDAAKLAGQITSTQITDEAITTPKIAAGAVTASEIAANTIVAGNIAANTITAGQIAAGAITASEIAAGAVSTLKLAAGAVTAAKIAANTITAAQIAANTITAGQIAAGAISTSELDALAVTADKIAANTITAAQIDAASVRAAVLVANSIAAGMIVSGAVTTEKLAALAVTADKIAANTITAAQIAANTITAGQIAAGAITASEIAAGAVNTSELAAGAVTAAKIAANTITAAQINAGSLRTAILTADSITSTHIATGAVTADSISTNQIITNAANIANGVIGTAAIANAAIESAKIANGAITNAKIADASITNAKISGTLQSDDYVAGAAGWSINKTNGTAEFGEVTVRGEIIGSSINASVLGLESARLMTASNRLAPLTIYDMGYSGQSSGTASKTITLTGFQGPAYGTINTYNYKRFARQRMDVFLEAIVNGDFGFETVYIEVQYNGGSWTTIESLRTDCDFRGGMTLSIRYTTTDTWDTVAFRARTSEGNTQCLSFKLQVFNFNETGNAAGSDSGGSSTGGSGGTPPPEDPWCVDYETTMLGTGQYVRDLQIGDLVECWDEDAVNPGIVTYPVLAIGYGNEESYTMRTASGVEIIQSRSTPMNLRDGRVVRTTEMLGEDVLVNRDGELTWETVVELVNEGTRKVVKVNLGDRMYFAGKDNHATIATHNIRYKPEV